MRSHSFVKRGITQHSRLLNSTSPLAPMASPSISINHQPLATTTKVYTTAKPHNKILLGSVDQGTTSTRFIVFDTSGNIVALHQREIAQYHPHAGWTEHDPLEILDSVNLSIDHTCDALVENGFDLACIKSIGITNQRETVVAWSAVTGKPLCKAIVWHDTRPQSIIDDVVSTATQLQIDTYRMITGLPMNTYFSGSKMKWMMTNVGPVKQAVADHSLRFGTVDSWLLYNMSGTSKVFCTDFTNASRTMLMDLKSRDWSPDMLDLFGVPRWALPKILPSSHVFARMAAGELEGVPISGVLGDQQAALVGHRCFGEGCFLLMNTGTTIQHIHPGLITTAGYDIPKLGPPTYAIEGSVAAAGSCVKFLRDNLNVITTTNEINDLATQVKHTGGCYFVPAFSGLYAPYWNAKARGSIMGMTSYTDRRHLCRAVLESVGFQVNDLLSLFPTRKKQLWVDGGLTNSDLCMQLQANILDVDVYRPRMTELSAFGVAVAAGLAVDCITTDMVMKRHDPDRIMDVFKPQWQQDVRTSKLAKWTKAVDRALNWVDDDDVETPIDNELVIE